MSQYRIYIVLIVWVFWLTAPLPAMADSDLNSNFLPAKPISRAKAIYPESELRSANTGFALVFYMIDKQGKTYEPVVVNSSGRAFEREALKVVARSKFEPATLNGNPVNSVNSLRIRFEVSGQSDRVHPDFARDYKSALKELKKTSPKAKKVQKYIRRMEKSTYLSSYAQVNLNLVKFFYGGAFGNAQDQIDAIRQVLLFESDDIDNLIALSKEQRISLEQNLVSLLIQSQDYGAAVEQYLKLIEIYPNAVEGFGKTISQINKNNCSIDQSLLQPVKISQRGNWFTYIQKNTFGITDIEGQIDEFKVRCDQIFSNFKYQENVEYTIPEHVSGCHIEVIGSPQTQAQIYQFDSNCN